MLYNLYPKVWSFPSESPKVMGLVGIHDPDALCHFSGITYCPWCRKESQNEGTVVNHLQTMHYRLGLVCNRCHDCPSTSSNTLCCHGQQDCHQPRENDPSESIPSELSSGEAQLPQLRILTRKSRQNGLPRLPCQEYPYLPLQPWGRTSREGITCQPAQPITYSSAKLDWAVACFQYTR